MSVDALKLYDRLRKTSLNDETAKEIAEMFRETNEELLDRLATKEDIDLKIEMVRKEIKELEVAFRREIKESELRLEVKIAESRTSTVLWVAGMMLAQTAGIVGVLIKFLGK